MSLIERVAELLGPVVRPNPNPKSSASGGGGGIPELDLIERAISASEERSGFPEVSDFAVESKTKARPARPLSRTTRTLRIDLDQLRRQSIITPDGGRSPITEGFRRIKRARPGA